MAASFFVTAKILGHKVYGDINELKMETGEYKKHVCPSA